MKAAADPKKTPAAAAWKSRSSYMRPLIAMFLLPFGAPCPGDEPASNMDSIASSTDDFLSLPKPPSTVPPAGSTGLLAPAAAAGPRFRPGSRVWCCPAGSEGGQPEEGTVGMVLSPAAGPGGQAVYKASCSCCWARPAVCASARSCHLSSFFCYAWLCRIIVSAFGCV
jgi:hypothetical protein